MNKIKVLIFPAGEVNSIELHDALSTCVNVEVWGASSIDRHGPYVFKNYVSGLPFISDENFIEKLNNLIQLKDISVIFPTHDSVALFLSEHRDKIKAKIIVASKKTTELCRDKLLTYRFFSNVDFVPTLYENAISYPAFIKPREGQGSVGARVIHSYSDIENIDLSKFVVTEYLPGDEYTVDCFTDKNGKLLFVSPRTRARTMAGISVAGETIPLKDEFKAIATVLNSSLDFFGLWWFQVKRDKNGKLKLLEISTRCAGTMALTRSLGVNLPLLSVYAVMGYEVKIEKNDYISRMDSSLIRRYSIDIKYKEVYIDFDDTIIINGKVYLKAIWFLYQCINNKVPVNLLTRHENKIFDTLNKYRIPNTLFKRIINVPDGKAKSDFIENRESIFIDNSFTERSEVKNTLNIPTFDVDGLDFLMDWRF